MNLTSPFTRIDNLTKKIKINKTIIFILLFISSFLEVFFYSLATSPRKEPLFFVDSPIFELIGKSWANGYLPYIDFWDLKGPYIFFVNMLGFLLFKSLTGVFILEIISLFITKIFLFKILKINYDIFLSLLLSLFCITLFLPFQWNFGNTVSEWNLPFLTASFYYIYKYFKDDFKYIDKKTFYLFGITFGICLMSRLSDAFLLTLFILATFLSEIYEKKYKNLILYIIYMILGILTIILPFSIYFYNKNALYEMWYGSVIYNFSYYAKNVANTSILNLFFSTVLVFAFLLLLFKEIIKKNFKYLFFFLPILFGLLFYLKGNCYTHYFIIFLPITFIFISEIKNKKINILIYLLLYLQLFIGIAGTNFIDYKNESVIKVEKACDSLFESIPENSSFLMVDADFEGIYLRKNIYPNNKYFELQSWNSLFSDDFKKEMIKDFENNMPNYVIVNKTPNICVYQEILNKNYEKIDEKNIDDKYLLTLYRKID